MCLAGQAVAEAEEADDDRGDNHKPAVENLDRQRRYGYARDQVHDDVAQVALGKPGKRDRDRDQHAAQMVEQDIRL